MEYQLKKTIVAFQILFIIIQSLVLLPPFLAIISFFIFQDINLFFEIWFYGWGIVLLIALIWDLTNN